MVLLLSYALVTRTSSDSVIELKPFTIERIVCNLS
jgi:hypothetical protein